MDDRFIELIFIIVKIGFVRIVRIKVFFSFKNVLRIRVEEIEGR